MRFATPRLGSRVTRIIATLGLVAGVLAFHAPSAGATAADSVSVGAVHACILTAAGGVKCWGYNGTGMLGDGTKHDRLKPVSVSGLSSGVADVQAAWDHTCALTDGGGVKCWGHNGDGELGDGTKIQRLVPVSVDGLPNGVSAISLGFDSGCALTTGGGVKCWGYNGNGQLGDGTRTTRKIPVNVFGLSSGVAAIAAGWDHTCALLNSGGVMCWGDNAHGEVGNGTHTDALKPVSVSGLASGVAAVSAGFDHTCALLNSGSMKCWGNNATGELGDGTAKSRKQPVSVHGLSNAASISAGFNHTCAVTTSGGAKCWGNNASGELGDGTTTTRFNPTNVYRSASGVDMISAGGWKGAGLTCLLTTSGAVKCFGANHGVHGLQPIASNGGQIGDGTTAERHIPIAVRGLLGANAKHYRPDNAISKFSGAGYVGNGVYNESGKNQTRIGSVKAGGAMHLYVRVQNDAKVTDSFYIKGTGPGGGFGVSYKLGGKNIKSAVMGGTYWLTLAPGATKTIVVTVSAGSGVSSGRQFVVKVSARSAGDSGKLDLVKGIVKV
jgi:alpha-tubulin suppressor-like RCC1 family protein